VIRYFCEHCQTELADDAPIYRFDVLLAPRTVRMGPGAHLHWACIVAYLVTLGAPTSPNPTANEDP